MLLSIRRDQMNTLGYAVGRVVSSGLRACSLVAAGDSVRGSVAICGTGRLASVLRANAVAACPVFPVDPSLSAWHTLPRNLTCAWDGASFSEHYTGVRQIISIVKVKTNLSARSDAYRHVACHS